MNEDDGVAAIQFVEERRLRLRAEIFAVRVREQHDAVGLQRVERVLEFRKRALDVRQRQRREEPETIRVLAHDVQRIRSPHAPCRALRGRRRNARPARRRSHAP